MLRTVFTGIVSTIVAGAPLIAQTGTIAGRVTSAESGGPIAQVQVSVVGAGAGAVTRDDGRYTIAVRPGSYTMRAQRIGYGVDSASVVVTAGGQATVNFQLRASAVAITGVVVVGYGTQEAKDLTGSVATVASEEFNTGRIVSPEALIRGKVAGVQVSENNEPGGGISIRIRGGTSVNASNEPLYVIDGVPIDIGGGSTVNGRNALNFLNPNDIETITVLKDASSTAIYGNRGANGVVIITTKTGGAGSQVTYTGTVSGSRVTGGPNLLDAAQYRTAVQTYAPSNSASLGSANTNWLSAIEQSAGGQEHNMGFSGRRETMNYRLGLGFLDQDGILIGSRTQRASASLNYSDRLLNDKLSLNTRVRGSRSLDWYTPGGVLGSAIAFAPTQPMYTDAGAYFQYRDPTSGALVGLAPNNPLEMLKYVQDQGNILRSIGNLEAEYRLPFLSGLSVTGRGSYDVNRADRNSFTPTNIASQLKADSLTRGSISRSNHSELHTVGDAYVSYRRDLPTSISGTMDLTAGVSAEDFSGSYNGYSARGLSSNLLTINGVPTFAEASPGVSVQEHLLRSQFGRANLNIMDRYLLTGTVRRDGSSRFGEGQKYGVFPSLAFAWRVLQESMFKDLPFSDLKLRVSWGRNGNEAIGCNYCAYGSYVVGNSQAQAQLGNTFVTTIRPVAFDANLHWETTTSSQIGLDYGIMRDRFTGSVDYYTKTTKDLLFNVPTAAGTALSNSVLTNIGSVQNKGIEFVIGGKIIDGGRQGFNWTGNFNASRNTNELLTIGRAGLTSIQTGGIAGGVGTTIQVLQAGQPVNSFYVYEHRSTSTGTPVNTGTDVEMYVDQNGDKIINTSDLRPFHSPAPKWIIGHTSNMTWKKFDASTTLRSYMGNYVYNNVASNLGNYSVLTSPFAPVNLEASVLKNGFTRPQYLSDLYVEDGSFIRMDNVTIGYTVARLGQLTNARLFGTVQNVFTSTKYTGVDPTASIRGIDNNVYPRSRTFVGGLSVGF
ncbi:MAG: SusC/RagA family TonB-linked outer membrane protein [Gemmatimonadota bacterium]